LSFRDPDGLRLAPDGAQRVAVRALPGGLRWLGV